jgi:hypothetical protein
MAMGIDRGRVFGALPAIVRTALPDGRIDFLGRRWSEEAGLSLDAARGWERRAAFQCYASAGTRQHEAHPSIGDKYNAQRA